MRGGRRAHKSQQAFKRCRRKHRPMPKTKRDVLNTIAAKITGEGGARLREQLKKKTAIDDMLDRPISDEEFAAELQKLETMIAALVAKKAFDEPGSWGLPN